MAPSVNLVGIGLFPMGILFGFVG